jgi:hypothetical protein
MAVILNAAMLHRYLRNPNTNDGALAVTVAIFGQVLGERAMQDQVKVARYSQVVI